MANPITECDRMRSYAAPDPAFRAAVGSMPVKALTAQILAFCVLA